MINNSMDRFFLYKRKPDILYYISSKLFYILLVLFLSITTNILNVDYVFECTNHGTYPRPNMAIGCFTHAIDNNQLYSFQGLLRDFLWLHQTADMVKFSADPNNSVIQADNPNSIKNRIKIIDGANQDQDHVTQHHRLLSSGVETDQHL